MRHLELKTMQELLQITEPDWNALQRLAMLYGWSGRREGDSLSQRSTRKLGKCLLKALPDVPRHDAVSHKIPDRDTPVEKYPTINLFEWFSGAEGRGLLWRVIEMCRGGQRLVIKKLD